MTTPSEDQTPKKEPLSPRTQAVLALVQGLLPALTAIIGGLWIAGTYLNDQRINAHKEAISRLIEAQRPFLERQLKMYVEATEVVGKMVTITPSSTEWDGLERRFWELYWTELTMVEDKMVEEAMVKYSKALFDYSGVYKTIEAKKVEMKAKNLDLWTADMEEPRQRLQGDALELAQAIRTSIANRWKGE